MKIKMLNITANNKLFAYTLAEIVTVLIVVAVIISVTIGVTKAKLDNVISYTYYSAYSALRAVISQILTDYDSSNSMYTDLSYVPESFLLKKIPCFVLSYLNLNPSYAFTESGEPMPCSEPDSEERSIQYCQGKEFDNTPGVCSWKQIVPWPPSCPEGEQWNNSATGCRCAQIPKTLPRKGENFCKVFTNYANTIGGSQCSGSVVYPGTTNFTDKTPDLILRNGIRIYNLRQNPERILVLQNNTDAGFYMDSSGNEMKLSESGYTLYVDIDGQNGPSELWQDVYPFYITMSGKVIPGYDKSTNPDGSGADSIKHLQVSVQNEIISEGKRKMEWLSKSVSFVQGACQSGYVGSLTPYCTGYPVSEKCQLSGANCMLKQIKPVKFF